MILRGELFVRKIESMFHPADLDRTFCSRAALCQPADGRRENQRERGPLRGAAALRGGSLNYLYRAMWYECITILDDVKNNFAKH